MVMLARVDLHKDLSFEERIEAISNISMKDKNHLKRWLVASGKQWLIFNAVDLVDALKWPDGVDVLMQLIACYKDHRGSIETGRVEKQKDPVNGKEVDIQIYKGEVLEIDEMEQTIKYLIDNIQRRDPRWNLTDMITR